MGTSRWRIVLFFVCMTIALVSPAQFARSQSLTTLSTVQVFNSSSVTAVIWTLTSSAVTQQTVQFALTPSDFNNETDTFTLGYSETAPYYPDNPLCLMYDYFLLNASAMNEFKVHFDTQQNLPIHFFILNMEQFNEFNHTNCANGFSAWELQVVAPASDLVWVAPESGEYAFLFLSGQFIGGYVRLRVQAYGQTVQTSTSTYATTSIIQLLSTLTSLSTLALTQASTDYSALIVGAMVVVFVVGVVVLLTMKRVSKAKLQNA